MATTNIELDIENITGVADADDQFIKTAQKFVVSSIPKNLMLWAGTTTAVGSHGGDSSPTEITLPQPTDNIIDVQRNGFSAEQVPESMQGFIANASSLHLATETFPKYYLQAGNKVIVKPNPSDSETALVNYVDFLKVDDDCDLRGAVVFHASSQEFEKLSTSKVSDWSDLVQPSPPTLTTTTVSFSTSVPTYLSPALEARSAFSAYTSGLSETDPGIFSIASVPPSTPSVPTISYSNASLGDAVAVAQDSLTAAVDSITLGPTDAAGVDVAAGPTDATGTSSTGSGSSAYTKPGLQGTPTELTAVAAGTFGSPAVSLDTWWDTLSDIIETEEDSELASSQIQKINSYITAFQAEVQSASAAMQASIEDARQSTQASIATAGDATRASIANAGNDVSVKNASIASQTQASIANASNDVNASIAKMRESTGASVSKMQQSTTAAIQKMQLSTNMNIQNAAKTLEASMQDYTLELQKYQADVGKYQAEVSKEVQEYTQKLSQYQVELQTSVQAWQQEENEKVARFQSEVQNNINKFNKENTEYQAQLQISIQNAQLESSEDAQKLQKFASDLQSYTSKINEQSQKFTLSSQNAVHYSNESKKYYEWAVQEVTMYIQNNSKMINRSMAAQAAAQQQRA